MLLMLLWGQLKLNSTDGTTCSMHCGQINMERLVLWSALERKFLSLSRRGAQCPSHYVHHDAMNKCSGGGGTGGCCLLRSFAESMVFAWWHIGPAIEISPLQVTLYIEGLSERASEALLHTREHALHSKIFDLNNLWEFMYVSDERARDTHTYKRNAKCAPWVRVRVLSQRLMGVLYAYVLQLYIS